MMKMNRGLLASESNYRFRLKNMTSIAALVLAAAVSSADPASATVWDVNTGWETGTQSGPWQYGYESSLTGPLTLFNTYNPNNGNWDSNVYQSSLVPSIWKPPGVNSTSVAINPGYNPETAFVVARWISPITGAVSITGSFAGTGMSDYIEVGGNNVLTWMDNGATRSYNLTENVVLGESIDFIVGQEASGYFSYGNTPITANITSVSAVPEPSTWAMMLGGFGALGFAGYRRQQRITIPT